VKSFESSTKALAGSHAAQHNVNCFVWATAWLPRHEAATTAVTPNTRMIWIIKTSLLSQAIACLPCQSPSAVRRRCTPDSNPAFTEAAGMMFSVVVKCQPFTKHIRSQCTPWIFLTGEVIGAMQPLPNRRSASSERRAEAWFV